MGNGQEPQTVLHVKYDAMQYVLLTFKGFKFFTVGLDIYLFSSLFLPCCFH